MILPVLPNTLLREIPKGCRRLHFVRPVKRKLVESILKKCRQLEFVTLSKSCMERMPKKSIAMLRKKGVRIKVAARQGRAISIPLERMQQALEMRKDYQSLREVEKITGISKSTVHYLERYAQRAKIRSGGKVVYLK